jgi:hypothetical protein
MRHAYGTAQEMRMRMGAKDDDDENEEVSTGKRGKFGNEHSGGDVEEREEFAKGRGARSRGGEHEHPEAEGPTGHRGRAIVEKGGGEGSSHIDTGKPASDDGNDENNMRAGATHSRGGFHENAMDFGEGHDERPSHDASRRTAISAPTNSGLPPPPTAKPLAETLASSPQARPGTGTGQTGPVPMGRGSHTGGLGGPMGGGMPAKRSGVSDEDLVRALSRNVAASLGKGVRNQPHHPGR